jgi:hypothetical protein
MKKMQQKLHLLTKP